MMNTIKKLTAALLAILLTLSFAACGAGNAPEETQQIQRPSEITSPTNTTPEATEPTVTEPPVTEPSVTEPPVTEPSVTEPPVTEPSVTEPPVTEPPVTEPPVTEPPVTEPPVTEPPVTEPPVTEPPVTDTANNYFLNDANNSIDLNAISIKPRYVYWKDGKLVAECFVINGFSHAVGKINVKSLTISNDDGVIASAAFGELDGVVLSYGQYCVWKFTFPADCVNAYNADLHHLLVQYNCTNIY